MTERPLAEPTELSEGFWDAARRHELVAQHCAQCGSYRHYPQLRCPRCLSDHWSWAALSGIGTIYSFTITHQAFHPAWEASTPYAVITVELAEGIRMVSDLPDGDLADVRIGAPVEVFFDDTTNTTLPRFRLAPSRAPHSQQPASAAGPTERDNGLDERLRATDATKPD